MKKYLLVCALLVLVGGFASADRATLDETKTQVAFPMSTPPTIDGVVETDEWREASGVRNSSMDCYWMIQYNDTAEDFVRGGRNTSTVTDGPLGSEDIQVQIFVGYDQNYLYVGVKVTAIA